MLHDANNGLINIYYIYPNICHVTYLRHNEEWGPYVFWVDVGPMSSSVANDNINSPCKQLRMTANYDRDGAVYWNACPQLDLILYINVMFCLHVSSLIFSAFLTLHIDYYIAWCWSKKINTALNEFKYVITFILVCCFIEVFSLIYYSEILCFYTRHHNQILKTWNVTCYSYLFFKNKSHLYIKKQISSKLQLTYS